MALYYNRVQNKHLIPPSDSEGGKVGWGGTKQNQLARNRPHTSTKFMYSVQLANPMREHLEIESLD